MNKKYTKSRIRELKQCCIIGVEIITICYISHTNKLLTLGCANKVDKVDKVTFLKSIMTRLYFLIYIQSCSL